MLRPPDLLSPSLPPPLLPLIVPTPTSPPPWEHGPTMEEAWGSGDYLETLSFMVPDGEELALATPLSNHPYDNDDGGDWVSYDTAFPTRPTLPLSSHLSLFLSSSIQSVLHTRPIHPDAFPTWDDDYDLEDMMPLEPTELLLPDMNSLEYYANLLAREREREREGERDRDQKRVRQSDSELTISPTTTQIYHSPMTPPPSSSSPPPQETKHPTAGPTPPLTLSSTVTAGFISVKTYSIPSLPDPRPKDHIPEHGRYPLSPPSNTTGWVLAPPHPGPPTHPDKPDRPAVVMEKPEKVPTTRPITNTTKTTAITTTTQITAISLTRAPPLTTPRAAQIPPSRQYMCNVTKPEMYLVRVGKTTKSHVTERAGHGNKFTQIVFICFLQSVQKVHLQDSLTSESF